MQAETDQGRTVLWELQAPSMLKTGCGLHDSQAYLHCQGVSAISIMCNYSVQTAAGHTPNIVMSIFPGYCKIYRLIVKPCTWQYELMSPVFRYEDEEAVDVCEAMERMAQLFLSDSGKVEDVTCSK